MTNEATKSETEQQPAVELKPLLCYDHVWELKDESFDHELGCEQVHYYEWARCEETRDLEAADYDPFID